MVLHHPPTGLSAGRSSSRGSVSINASCPRRTRRRAQQPTAACAAATAAAATAAFDALVDWIRDAGGTVDARLTLSEQAPCGVRGIVTTSPVPEAALEQGPLIALPYALYFEDKKASALLAEALGSDTVIVQELGCVQALALALAHERAQGAASAWHTYISTLPHQPPCPWLLPEHDVAAAVAAALQGDAQGDARTSTLASAPSPRTDPGDHGGIARPDGMGAAGAAAGGVLQGSSGCGGGGAVVLEGWQGPGQGQQQQQQLGGQQAHHQQQWEGAVGRARAQHEAECQEALDACGCQLGLTMQDMLWGLGQVTSRSLTSGGACGLLPLIDLLNHHPAARPPMMQLDGSDQLVMTVTSLHDGLLHPLAAGEELYINYSGGGAITPLESFLKFGFVPDELWQQHPSLAGGDGSCGEAVLS